MQIELTVVSKITFPINPNNYPEGLRTPQRILETEIEQCKDDPELYLTLDDNSESGISTSETVTGRIIQ